MVDLADVTRAAGLVNQSRRLARALLAFDAADFAITQMTVSPGLIAVDTRDMAYPVQMKDAIRTLLEARKETIDNELRDIGVTVPEMGSAEPVPGPPSI